MNRISDSGDEGEEEFLRLVPGAIKSRDRSLGDCIVPVMIDGLRAPFYVEVKTCRVASRGTLNQVRAIKYSTTVVYVPLRRKHWIVIPADVIVRKVYKKRRGQHTEVPFECAAISLNGWEERYACSSRRLAETVEKAILRSNNAKYDGLRKVLRLMKRDLERFSAYARLEVKAVLLGDLMPWDDRKFEV